MIRLFYDADYCGGCFSVEVINTETKEAKIIIDCECGAHLLQIQSDVEIYTNSNETKQVHQTFYLAMFSYGRHQRSFIDRVVIAWKYLKTGKMFSDQLSLTPDEAKKMSVFIEENIIETNPHPLTTKNK